MGHCLAVVPGHPFRWAGREFLGVFLQFGQVIQGVDAVQLAGVNQTHEQVADVGAVLGLIKQTNFGVV